jgi:hypothetical protein
MHLRVAERLVRLNPRRTQNGVLRKDRRKQSPHHQKKNLCLPPAVQHPALLANGWKGLSKKAVEPRSSRQN